MGSYHDNPWTYIYGNHIISYLVKLLWMARSLPLLPDSMQPRLMLHYDFCYFCYYFKRDRCVRVAESGCSTPISVQISAHAWTIVALCVNN